MWIGRQETQALQIKYALPARTRRSVPAFVYSVHRRPSRKDAAQSRTSLAGNIRRTHRFLPQEDGPMADDKSKRGGSDRRRVAGGEGYEVKYFARKHGISKDQAQKLIDQVGNDREKLNAAAGKLARG